MIRHCSFWFFLLLLGLASVAVAQQEIMLSPQLTQLEIPPGGKKTFEVTIVNASDKQEVKISVKPMPIVQRSNGDYVISNKQNPWSCAQWIELDKQILTIPPGRGDVVRCTIKVPYGVSGGRYAAIAVSFASRHQPAAGVTMDLEYRMGSYVELTIAKSQIQTKAEIKSLEIVPASSSFIQNTYGKEAFFITADVHNSGNVGVIAQGMLRIRDTKGLKVREVPLGSGRGMVLPDATVKYRSLFTRLPPSGAYSVEASVDYGGFKPSIARMVFTVTSDGELKPGVVEAVDALSIGIEPRYYDLRVPGGSERNLIVTLINNESHPIHLRTQISGFTQSSEGRYLTIRNLPLEAEWVTLDPTEFDLEPNIRKRVKLRLKVPKEAAGSRYLRIAFIPEGKSIGRDILEENYKTDLFIEIPPTGNPSFDITSLRASTQGRYQPIEYMFTVRNKGNSHADIEAQIIVTDSKGATVKELKLQERNLRILPGVSRTFVINESQGLEAGTYEALLIVRVKEKLAARHKSSFSISG